MRLGKRRDNIRNRKRRESPAPQPN